MCKKLFVISLILFSLCFTSFGQKVSPAKQKLAKEITNNTSDLIPIDFFEDMFEIINDGLALELANSISAGTLEKISQNKPLSDEQKTALKPKVDEFSKTISKKMQDILMKNFDIRKASIESLQNNYEKVFTLAELQKLNSLFKTATGKRFIKRFKEMTNDKLEGKESNITNADMKMFEQISKVISIKIFQKFTDVLIPETMNDIQLFVKDWSETAKDTLDKDLENQNLKAQIEQFVTENSK